MITTYSSIIYATDRNPRPWRTPLRLSDTNHIKILLQEFDKDGNGEIDFSEFRTIAKYLQKEDVRKSASSTVLYCTVF